MAPATPQSATPEAASDRPALILAAAAGLCIAYAAFAEGASDLSQESRLQVALAVIALAAIAGCLYGGLRLSASPAGWTGLALLALFAGWCAVSITWSVTPDASWAQANRAIAYALVVLVGIVIGSSSRRAARVTVIALAIAAAPVALYAVGGKTLPGLYVDGVFDLDHAAGFNRLKAPLEYWNALALFCVLGLLPTLRLAADPARGPRARVTALLGIYVLSVVIGLTYSRGGLAALAVGLVAFVALTTERVRTVVLAALAGVAALVPLAVALSSDDLTTDRLPLAQREDDALIVLGALVVAGAVLAAAGWLAMRAERRPAFTPARGRRIGRVMAAAAGGLALVGVIATLLFGAAGEAVDSFTSTHSTNGVTNPDRVLSVSSGNRWTWWKEAAGAWSDRPVRGWGAGSFPVTHRLYRRDVLDVQQPHSVPLQWLAETGLVGLVLAGGALLALLAAAVARVRVTPERGAAAALAAAGFAWLLHGAVDWDWDIPAVTVPMLLGLGVLAGRPTSPPPPVVSRAPALAVAVVAAVLVTVSAVLPALAEQRTTSALTAVGGEVVEEDRLVDAAADAELAAQLNPLAVEPLIAGAAIAERRGRSEEARRLLLRALERQPYSLDAWIALTRVELTRQSRSGVRRAAQRALELDPANPEAAALAQRARQAMAPPGESATATGTPLSAPVAGF